MAQSGPHIQLMLKWTKRTKGKKKSSFFWRGNNSGRERVRGERKLPPSLYDLLRSGGRNPSSQDLKFIYSTRATRGYRQHAVSPKVRFTAIGGSVSVEPRLKVGVLIEGNAWTPKSRIFVEDSSGSLGRSWVSGLRDSKKFRLHSKR